MVVYSLKMTTFAGNIRENVKRQEGKKVKK